ncbi:unnamed protein product [Acanthoscelides obtectus]|uniref:Uncharacterized protein n=1 Tax=Acanthoscelides obtectus TaxID=200917 RepID=A0A9P0LEN9_ACAOB|nr:unnamed protein product [Acanthoscelides obtectus]CAK1657169.1 hypothetical protein AOBTE_LOCUS20173 [Acanthoscelides obtectus]
MNTKIITHGEPGKSLGNTRRNCPYQEIFGFSSQIVQ